MTDESKADSADSEHASRSLWQRLSPFLDVIGALLIFGSWIFSHSLSQQAQDQGRRVDRLWLDYDAAQLRMLQVSDQLLQTAGAEADSASQLAKQCERLSWVLYIIGTLIVLYGRAKSVIGAKKSGTG